MSFDVSERDPAVQEVMQWFDYEHLSDEIRPFSQECHDLAVGLLRELPDSPQLLRGLYKLVEAKDCFVRAAIADLNQQAILIATGLKPVPE